VRPETVFDYRLDELVADVLAIADSLGWPRFDLVGHDWGALVAWAVAAAHPDRLTTLTAVSVPHPTAFDAARREDEDQQQRSAYIQTFQQAGTAERRLLAEDADRLRRIYERRVPRDRVDEYVARLSEPGALTAALNWYRALRYNTDVIGPVSVPTLYVWGTDDVAIGSAAALGAEKYVSGPYRFELLEELSHWIPEEAGGLLTALLMRHLADFPD
jgi:pimeloyl-ACP methyl ester carboxylesterase